MKWSPSDTQDQTQITPKKAKSIQKQKMNKKKRKAMKKKQAPKSKKQKMNVQKQKVQTKKPIKTNNNKRAARGQHGVHGGGFSQNLVEWLESMNLATCFAGIVEMGATTVSEVVDLEPADLEGLGLKKLEKRRLWRNVLYIRKGMQTHPDDVVKETQRKVLAQTCSGPDDFSKDAKIEELCEEVHELRTKNDGLSKELMLEKDVLISLALSFRTWLEVPSVQVVAH